MTNRHLCVTKVLFLTKIDSFLQSNFVKNSLGKREKISQFFQNIGEEKNNMSIVEVKRNVNLRQGLSHFCVKSSVIYFKK